MTAIARFSFHVVEPGRLVRLTRDHTVVQRMRDAGEIDADAARVHPQRHLLTAMVGASDTVAELFVHREEIPAGARYLLVSDGITRVLDDAAILAILDAEPDPDRAVRALVARAEADVDDNATALLVCPMP